MTATRSPVEALPCITSQPCTTCGRSIPGTSVGHARDRTRCNDHRLWRQRLDRVDVRIGLEPYIDSQASHLVFLEIDLVFERIAPGGLGGDEQLTSQALALLEQGHLVATHGCHPRGFESGKTTTDDHDAFRFVRRPELFLPAHLMADDRIDGAGRRVGEGRGSCRLVDAASAGDAAAYLHQTALACLVGEFGIGDTRSHHAHQIAIPVLDQLLRHTDVVDAPGEQDGDLRIQVGEVDARRFADLAKLCLTVVRRRHIGRRAPAVTDIDVHEIEQAGFADVDRSSRAFGDDRRRPADTPGR